MLKASSEIGIDRVAELANSIMSEGVVSVDWEVYFKQLQGEGLCFGGNYYRVLKLNIE